jgi:hypothetical protein
MTELARSPAGLNLHPVVPAVILPCTAPSFFETHLRADEAENEPHLHTSLSICTPL